jgi:hypothetical protein
MYREALLIDEIFRDLACIKHAPTADVGRMWGLQLAPGAGGVIGDSQRPPMQHRPIADSSAIGWCGLARTLQLTRATVRTVKKNA